MWRRVRVKFMEKNLMMVERESDTLEFHLWALFLKAFGEPPMDCRGGMDPRPHNGDEDDSHDRDGFGAGGRPTHAK